jgi:diguanylate cyclase (GGDEF)-like protein
MVLSVVVPLVFAVGLSWMQTARLINELAFVSDKAANERSEKLVRSAFSAYRGHLESVAIDSANWDDAAENVNFKLDLDWVKSTFLTSSKDDDVLYDTFMVVNGNTGETITTYERGKVSAIGFQELNGVNWSTVVAQLPSDANTSGSISFFVNTGYGAAIVAIAPVVGEDPSLATKNGKPNYFVFIRHLDAAFLVKLSEQYAIEDLSLDAKDLFSRDVVTLSDDVRVYSPVISWRTNQSDFANKWELWSHALKTLAATLVVLIGMAVAYWRSLIAVQRSEEKAVYDALHDNLTGLGNRAAFKSKLAQFSEGAIAFTDLDGFKSVNDVLGHNAGDLVLIKVADQLKQHIGAKGEVFRLGGDEFVMMFPGKNRFELASNCADRLIEALRTPLVLEGKLARVGLSIGIAYTEHGGADIEGLIKDADHAMYEAKKAGGNRWTCNSIVPAGLLKRKAAAGYTEHRTIN